LKAAVADRVTALLRACGAMGPLRGLLAGQGVVLMLHEVQDAAGPALSGAVADRTLDWMLGWLRREGWELVSLDEVARRLQDPERASRPFAALTFDDGYRDTLNLALPVLQKHAAPFAVYVPTKAVTRELYSWWLGLRELFLSHDQVEIESLGLTFRCPDRASKEAALNQVTAAVHQDYAARAGLTPTFERYRISLPQLNDRFFMDEGELHTLSRHPLATVGGHTVSHEALATLGEAPAAAEIAENRRFLQQLLDQPVDHFAYPYGNARACGPREAALAAAAGYRTAVTTRQSTVRRGHSDPLFLPRIRAPETIRPASFDGRVSGLYFALRKPGAASRAPTPAAGLL
jgi:peptidoglycan/xylan/chitin deacetylase (PgdA/CDA1 family)